MSFYKMERGWLDHEAWEGAPYSEREAWVWLIEEARWEDGAARNGLRRVPVKRGQVYASIRFMAEKFKWSTNRVLRYIEMLKNWDMVETATETGQTIITIKNYSKYQDDKRQKRNTNGDTSGDTDGDTGGDKQEERKKVKEKNIGSAPKPDDVTEQTWSDFLALRKRKNSPVTATVLSGIRKEATKAGFTLEQALAETCTRGWQSFKAEWVKPDYGGKKLSAREQMRRATPGMS